MSTPTADLRAGDRVRLTGASWSPDHPLANPDDPHTGDIVTITQADDFNAAFEHNGETWYVSDDRPGAYFEDDYSGTRVAEAK